MFELQTTNHLTKNCLVIIELVANKVSLSIVNKRVIESEDLGIICANTPSSLFFLRLNILKFSSLF